MNITEFIQKYQNDFFVSMAFALVLVGLLFAFAFFQKKHSGSSKSLIFITLLSFAAIFGISFSLINKGVDYSRVLIVDLVILVFLALYIFKGQDESKKEALNTRKIAFLGLMVAMASVLMMFGFPIMPSADYLKVEISGLIIFMTLLWFDFKTALLVSIITNLLNGLLFASISYIFFLDQAINFLATFLFLFPSYLVIRKQDLAKKSAFSKILLSTLIGVLLTTIFMTLYNYYINLPLIYNIPMTFTGVLAIFVPFNLVKWGFVAVSINLLWKKLYPVKELFHFSQKKHVRSSQNEI